MTGSKLLSNDFYSDSIPSNSSLTISIAHGTQRHNIPFTRALQYPYPEPNQPSS